MTDRIYTPESETRMFLRGEVSKAEAGWKWEGPGGDDAGERRYSRKDTWPTRGKQPKRKVKVLRSGDAVQKSWWKFGAKKAKKAVPFKQPGPGQPGYGPGPAGPGGPPRPGSPGYQSMTGGPSGPSAPLGRTTTVPKKLTPEQKRAAEARNPFSERSKILDAERSAKRTREMRDYNTSQLSYKDSGQRPR